MKKILPIILIGTIAIIGFVYKSSFFKKEIVNDINLSINNPIKSFDPVIAFDDDSLSVIGQSLDTLYQYHYLIYLQSLH